MLADIKVIDFANFSIASLALWIGYLAYRSTSTVWLRIFDIQSAYRTSLDENQGKGFHFFSIKVQNRGLPLTNMKVCFAFTVCGRQCTFQMMRKQPSKSSGADRSDGQFVTGAVGEFELHSYTYDTLAKELRFYRNSRENCAEIRIYQDGFLICTFPLSQRFHSIRSRWNSFADGVNWRFRKMVKVEDGRELLKVGEFVPTFTNQSQFRTDSFCNSVKEEESNDQNPEKSVA